MYHGSAVKCWWKNERSCDVLSENRVCVLRILGLWHNVFDKYFHLCHVRSICWIPDSSQRLSKHSHYNSTAPTVSVYCLMNMNTLSKGHCHSHEYILKKGDLSCFCETILIQMCWKDSKDITFIGIQWMRQALQPGGWQLSILHHLMRPCSSIYMEEQMVEASHPSFSLQSVQRRWRR